MRTFIFCWLPVSVVTATNLRHSGDLTAGLRGFRRDDASLNGASYTGLQPQTFKLTLSNVKGVQYTAPVSLNNQTLMAVYDTGSFEIMAVSRQCSVCNLPVHLATYDNSTSQSFVAGDRPIEDHHFAGGLVVARQDFETVHVGTVESVFKVENMAFWQVVHTDMLIWKNRKASFTAIVGLGHRGAVPDTPDDEKPMESLIERTGTERFAICLMRGPSNPGYLIFNPTFNFDFGRVFRRISVIGKHHWAVNMNSVSASHGSEAPGLCTNGKKCIAIIDSGTSLIGVPPNAVDFVFDLVKQIRYDCSNLEELPKLTFELDGHKFVMPASAYTVQLGEPGGKPSRCLPAFTDFAMTSGEADVWILGMPFLRHFYTVFDRKEPSIYVAEQGENCEPAVPNVATPTVEFFNSTGHPGDKQQRLPTMVDMSEAALPSWAYGQKQLTI